MMGTARRRTPHEFSHVKKHLYNTAFGRKVPWFVKRFGASEMLFKPLRVTLAPVIIPFLARRSFEFDGRRLDCFYHGYNMTWAGERTVEIPIAKTYLDRFAGKPVLEVGNVMSHYFPAQYDIVDKFEKAPGIINEDILDYHPSKRYDLILSVSTFEHIGFDDDSTEPSRVKILAAIAACRALLAEGGILVLTLPIGYNPDLDDLISTGDLRTSRELYLRRTGPQQWEPAAKADALQCRFKTPYPYANGLLVAEFARS
jgi:SAM-dependent methyltransferase